MFDYDNDGYQDLFFVNGAKLLDPMPNGTSPDKSDPRFWNRLYRNNKDGTFTDVTEKAGLRASSYGMGVATGDYDNDGNTDLLVSNLGGNTLYRNNGDGTFSDVTKKAGGEWQRMVRWCLLRRLRSRRVVGSDRHAGTLIGGFAKNVHCGAHRPGVSFVLPPLINLAPYLAWFTTTMATALSRTSRSLGGYRSISGQGAGDCNKRL